MKKGTVITASLLLLGFSSLYCSTVEASSVTEPHNYAEVSSDNAELYDSTGNSIERSLPYGSDWLVGRILNGKESTSLYRVGLDEYLSSKDSFLYKKRPEVIEVSDPSGKVPVYNHDFVESSEVALETNTYWYSDTVIYTAAGMPFARVAPDEYVPFYEVISQSFTELF